MRRHPWITAIAVVAAVLVVWLSIRGMQDRNNRQRAYVVIKELGGGVAWFPSPLHFLTGSEIGIKFHNTQFKNGGLKRLSVLQPLTSMNWVRVMFEDTNVSRRDIIDLQAVLPDCRVFRVVDGERHDDR